MIKVADLSLSDVKLIQLDVFVDERGLFMESYCKSLYVSHGIDCVFVQDNHSVSKKGTIRGLHFQSEPGQAKLISVIVGTIYDVFVDIRPSSPTFGKWGAVEIDAARYEQVFIPRGFAHGFAVLSDVAHVMYKVSSVYHPKTEQSIFYADPDLGIEWPITHPILSDKDRNALPFKEVVIA